MENKISIIHPSSVWFHIADTLLVAEDLTKEMSPSLAHRLHTIATSIDTDGISNNVGIDWIKGDCELIAEYPTWQKAVNSKEFNNE